VAKKKRPDEEICKDFNGKQLKAYLSRTHLPKNYADLSPKGRLKARRKVFSSWFDPKHPEVLCTNVGNYIASHYLYVEYYCKPAEMNRGTYFYDDPLNKYDMLRTVMSPSLDPDKPSKAIIRASRRLGKTQTLIIEAIPHMVLNRPFTPTLVSELNDKRTREEVKKIRAQITGNSRIHSDYGADGVLFPKRSGEKEWSSSCLEFLHLPGCSITGQSIGSAQRGRGPLYGAIDDPESEDDDNCFTLAWRKWFFAKLLEAYVFMFHKGGKLAWIGTPIHEGSCLSQAMRGKSETVELGEASDDDPRFEDWKKGRFSLIVRKTKGDSVTYQSMQPQRLSPEAFNRMLEVDPISAMKEVLCEATTPGVRAFRYDSARHGYLHATREGDDKEYMVDLCTGEVLPWKEFLSKLSTRGAGDLADGQSADADPGALVVLGVRSNRVAYILDAYNVRCSYEKLVEKTYLLAELNDCEIFGWEKTGLLNVINRMTKRYVDELRSRGRLPPVFRELDNAKRNKIRRILTITTFFSEDRIRFLVHREVRTPDGTLWTPVKHPREGHLQELLSQVREFTDEGLRGPDDLVDCLEMALRLYRGEPGWDGPPPEEEDPTDQALKMWAEAGIQFTKEQVPREAWTEEMHREALGPGIPGVPETEIVPCM
jgi:hypothetical protein